MVRINIIEPRALADQHLIAEYNEMLMLLGYVRRYPKKEEIPENYLLGPGHMKFFKDKLKYLKKRHELIKTEMRRRGFKTEKSILLKEFPRNLHGDWKPKAKDKVIIKERIIQKLKMKPMYYRYCSEHKPVQFFIKLIRNAR